MGMEMWLFLNRRLSIVIEKCRPGMMAHAFNPRTWEAGRGIALSSRLPWSTQRVPGQPELHRETLFQKKKERKKRGSEEVCIKQSSV